VRRQVGKKRNSEKPALLLPLPDVPKTAHPDAFALSTEKGKACMHGIFVPN